MLDRRIPLALALLVAACASPPHVAAPPPEKPPVVLAPPKPVPTDWRDAAEAPGTWRYAQDAGGSSARFGRPNALPAFELRCERASHTVLLVAVGTGADAITVVTSYEPRSFTAVAASDGHVIAKVAAADPFLDKIAFSRGRFEVVVAGQPPLILPAWAEPARVIEDCRG